jgi:phosphatidyl-myo-inositol dimannoside synthase
MLRTNGKELLAARAASSASERVLLLTPSRGLGGGIERYARTLQSAFAAQPIECHRIDLDGSGIAAHRRLLKQSRAALRDDSRATRLVVLHVTLLPAARLLAREHAVSGISVLCHGTDVWCTRPRIRRRVESYLLRRPDVRVLAMSSFTAGALCQTCPATVLPSGMSKEWFDTLVSASTVGHDQPPGAKIVTLFRLPAWEEKGLPELLSAVTALKHPGVSLTVCGSGEASEELRLAVRNHPCCTLRQGLSDHELATELATADLFVLATRTRAGRQVSGEGFGVSLLEAQVAGTPVVGPAYGGSPDAYIDRVTGVAPVDESAEALAETIDKLLCDPQRLKRMGEKAREWARECFAPERYAELVVAKFL